MKSDKKPAILPGIRNITVSGRIATGKTTLADNLGQVLGWDVLDGGKIFRQQALDANHHIKDANKRPDKLDIEYEEKVKKILKNEKNHVIQSHLAGFDAQGIDGVFKILVVCRNEKGEEKTSVRIDRLVNRDGLSIKSAKEEVIEREEQNLKKFRKLYAKGDKAWVYWDERYYDLTVNTFSLNQKEALEFVLKGLHYDV